MQPRSNSLSTRIVMAICSHLAKTMAPHRASYLLLAALLIPTTVFATDSSGPVASVLDGDTLEVLHGHHPERIRLNGIDCPEKGPAWRPSVGEDRFQASRLYRFVLLRIGSDPHRPLPKTVPI